MGFVDFNGLETRATFAHGAAGMILPLSAAAFESPSKTAMCCDAGLTFFSNHVAADTLHLFEASPLWRDAFAISDKTWSPIFDYLHSHAMHYFKRHWDESRGDAHDDWGTSTWYFETEADMWPTRQMEVYANGRVLRYGPQHLEDEFGRLSEAALDAMEFAPFAIGRSEFEEVWGS